MLVVVTRLNTFKTPSHQLTGSYFLYSLKALWLKQTNTTSQHERIDKTWQDLNTQQMV
jgi:hypothetical protein